MKVLVCGGRDYGDIKRMFVEMAKYAADAEVIVHGGAHGADALAQLWADAAGICCKVYPANWKQHGRAAGPMRNQAMLDIEKPERVIAFPGGRGTADMVRRAKAAGVNVIEILEPISKR